MDKLYVVRMSHAVKGTVYAHPDGPPTVSRDQALKTNQKNAEAIVKLWTEFWIEKNERGVTVIAEEA